MDEEHKKKEEQKEHHFHDEKKNFTKKVRENPWIISTFIFGIVIIILLFPLLGIAGGNVSGAKAGNNLISYLNSIADSEVTLKNVDSMSGLYKVTVEYMGKDIPLYVTKDGKSYTSTLLPLIEEETEQTSAEIPKKDRPVVELYVFTYCPYGLQMEKAFYPVVQLLGNKAEFKIRQIGAMHGEYEKIEAERQLCILKEYPEKYWNYVNDFAVDTSIGSCSSDMACSEPFLEILFSKLGIDKNKINSCMISTGKALYEAEIKNSGENGVSGSPTVIINGVETSLSRSPEAVKAAVCSAFKNPPAECSQILSENQASAGFGGGTSSDSTSASC